MRPLLLLLVGVEWVTVSTAANTVRHWGGEQGGRSVLVLLEAELLAAEEAHLILDRLKPRLQNCNGTRGVGNVAAVPQGRVRAGGEDGRSTRASAGRKRG